MRRLFALAWVCLALTLHAQEQYPAPLKHTPTDHPADHVVLLNIEGLHAIDLDRFVARHPDSTLAALTTRSVTYTNAHLTWNTEAAGLLALTTGGTPLSTGVYSATQNCVDHTPRVNTIFDLVHARGGTTAWAAASAPELALLNRNHALNEADTATTDDARIALLDRWLAAKPSPTILGTTLTAFAIAQSIPGSYGALGHASPQLDATLSRLDSLLAKLVTTLREAGLYDRTWIILSAASTSLPARTSATDIAAAIHRLASDACVTVDGLAHIWLPSTLAADKLAVALASQRTALGIDQILTPDRLNLLLAPAAGDPRRPVLVLVPATGTRWASPAGARSVEDNANVALIVSGSQFQSRRDPTPIPTTQTAAMLLRALGLEKLDLDALHREHSPALPGIF